jgi:hypothetical protein
MALRAPLDKLLDIVKESATLVERKFQVMSPYDAANQCCLILAFFVPATCVQDMALMMQWVFFAGTNDRGRHSFSRPKWA